MTIVRAILLGAVLAAPLAAQQQAGSAANPVTTSLRGRITGLHANIAQAFDSIPESKFDFKPTAAQLSIGYIAQHVAEDNYLFCNAFGDRKAEIPASATSTPDSVKAKWPKDTLLSQLNASFKFCDEAIDQVNDANLGEQVSFSYGGRSRSTTRASMVVGHALDLADHYSQLANYMRLNGILPPTALPRRGRGGQ